MDVEIKRILEKINDPIKERLYSISKAIEFTSYGMDINGTMANERFTGKLEGIVTTLVDLNVITLYEYDVLFEYFLNYYHEEGENE